MERGWILLILIAITAIATVFAWSIDSLIGLIVLGIGIIVIILTAIYLIRTSNDDSLAKHIGTLGGEDRNVMMPSSPASNLPPQQSRGRRDDDAKTVDIPVGSSQPPEPEPSEDDRYYWDSGLGNHTWQPPDETWSWGQQGHSAQNPPPEPQPSVEATEGEEDLIVFTDIDDEISKEKAKPDSKPLPPPAPPSAPISPGQNFRVSDKADEDLFSEEETDEREQSTKGDTRVKETQFTAYYARQSAANTEYGFYVYAHLPEALISADIQQFEADLGGRIPKAAVATQTATLKEGALLTAMVECDALQFNQIGIMKKWKSPFVRFDFRYTAPEALIDEFVEGRVAIMLGMIEIASIGFQTLITAPKPINLFNTLPDDPIRQAHFEPTNPASMYQKIFISYSRKDTVVAEEFRKAQIMMGNTIFMDTHTIRAGEAWEEALKRFIREADVFQLFWSEYSASSDHCRFEWEYALNYRCSDTRCVGFIRPAYWKKPLPTPPPELGHLHFAYVPQEGIVN